MNSWLNDLIAKYRSTGILVDTNLLLVFIVGLYDHNLIKRFFRTEKYSKADFLMLQRLLSFFPKIVSTPHVLTEVSNFLGKLADPAKTNCREILKSQVEEFEEQNVSALECVKHAMYLKFGLPDVAIVLAASKNILILTEMTSLWQVKRKIMKLMLLILLIFKVKQH